MMPPLSAVPRVLQRPLHRCCAGAGIALALIFSGCGVHADSGPRALPTERAEAANLPANASDEPNDGNRPASVFLVSGTNSLIPVPREVESVSVAGITRATLADPTAAEVAAGITTSIPRGTQLVSGSVRSDGVIAIDLSSEFAQVAGANRTTAFGQIVLGVGMQYDPERKFSFAIDGERVSVSTAEGARTIVTPCDFLDAVVEPRELEPEVTAVTDLEALGTETQQLETVCPDAAG